MDVHDKLDELSALVEGARAMPMSASCVVNRGQVLDLLDEVRSMLPTSLDEADEIMGARDAILADAQAQAVQVLEQADAEALHRVSDHEVYRAAVREAEVVRGDAAAEADRMRRETDDYVDGKLANFEVALHRTLDAVQKGRDKIRGRHAYDDLGDAGPLPGDYDGR